MNIEQKLLPRYSENWDSFIPNYLYLAGKFQ